MGLKKAKQIKFNVVDRDIAVAVCIPVIKRSNLLLISEFLVVYVTIFMLMTPSSSGGFFC